MKQALEEAKSVLKRSGYLEAIPEVWNANAMEVLKKLVAAVDDFYMCFDCGAKLDEVQPVGGKLGEIHFDPGSTGSSCEPPEPAEVYFVCASCVKAQEEKVAAKKPVKKSRYDLICPLMSKDHEVPCIKGRCQLWDFGLPHVYEANCSKIPRQDRRIE